MPSVLVVITGADHWTLTDGTKHPTGFWAEELLVPVSTFHKAGIQLDFATPGGVRPTVDEGSLSPEMAGGEDEAARQRTELDGLFAGKLAAPLRLEDVKSADYDAVYIPGGHGPMEDLAVSPVMGELLISMLDSGKIVSSVCHGPAALLSASRANGEWAFAGRTLSGFLNEEERQAGLADKAPWLLEDRLRAGGAEIKTGEAWAPLSVVDNTIVTGQNPASSGEVAEKVVAQLNA
jgi:putative intracellular protease/amidase